MLRFVNALGKTIHSPAINGIFPGVLFTIIRKKKTTQYQQQQQNK